MQKRIGSALALVALVAVPAMARAQARAGGGMGMDMPKHEFGVDAALVYSSPSGGTATFNVFTPVDVRVGFVSSGKMMWEPRLTLNFASGGGTFLTFDPGVNVLFKLGNGTGHHNMMGPYWTVGGDINIISNSPTGGTSVSGQVITINGGIGTRMAWGSAAKRIEGFVAYSLKNTSLGVPNTFHIGARVGLSLWH
jgi:hypothetical protein